MKKEREKVCIPSGRDNVLKSIFKVGSFIWGNWKWMSLNVVM